MKFTKYIAFMLLCTIMLNGMGIPAAAQENTAILENEHVVVEFPNIEEDSFDVSNNTTRATNRFDWSIPSGVTKKANTAFSLDADETVTINCTFSPRNSDVDFGLIAPNGRFYYTNADGGSFNNSIRVNETGKYYLAIRNNSDQTIQVMGFVYY
ncbi:MAG: hypothetical protein KHX40_11560 [Oscillospiraceae bacterium]|nr:hypothetical protein [Oscillospiraceae bacterium]